MNDLILAAVRQYLSKSESEKNKSAVN